MGMEIVSQKGNSPDNTFKTHFNFMIETKRFIPKEFHKDPKILHSVSAIVVVDLIIFVISLLFIPIFSFIDFSVGVNIMIYSAIAAAFYFVILHAFKNLDWCGNYFSIQSLIVCLSLMYYTGGIASPYLFWLFCICPVSFLYFQERHAMFWAAVTTICFLFFALAQIIGFPFEQHLSPLIFYATCTVNFSFALFIFVVTVRSFQNRMRSKNRELNGLNAQLKNTNLELERFAYIASHDLKSPLRSIMSFVGIFEKRYGHQFDEQGKEFLQIINSNADQMHHLIEDILEYSQSNDRVARKEKVVMNKLLEQISDQIHAQNNYPDGKILYGELPNIDSDFTLLKQIFQNLIENGLKYNDSPHKIISIQYLEKEEELYFRIKDNGIGMEEEYLEKIFEMFQRLHTQNEYQGTGIGLAICKKTVEQLGGKIWVSSKIGEGSIFHFSLPKSFLWKETEQVELTEVLMN